MAYRILPALVTPLTPDDRLDEPSLERLVDHLLGCGVSGLYVLGSTGEGVYLDVELRRRVTERVVELVRGRGETLIHVGAVQALQAYRLAEHAAGVGADAVSSIPPSLGGYRWAEVLDYYQQLGRAGDRPVIGYYIPLLTKSTFSLAELRELLSLDAVGGLKFTDFDLYLLGRLALALRDDQILYNGPDQVLALGLQMGAGGGIGTTYNLMPELIVQIAQHVADGEIAAALEAQRRLGDVIEILHDFHVVAATKQILCWQGLIDSPRCAPPRAALTDDEQRSLRRRLEATVLAPTLVR